MTRYFINNLTLHVVDVGRYTIFFETMDSGSFLFEDSDDSFCDPDYLKSISGNTYNSNDVFYNVSSIDSSAEDLTDFEQSEVIKSKGMQFFILFGTV